MNQPETVAFGGGCFWCTEAIFQRIRGVTAVTSGYAGGKEDTGHAEVVKITYDPTVISFTQLLEVFFATHDPTSLNRQGADVGTQYRSIILTTTEEQEKQSKNFIHQLTLSGKFSETIKTEVHPLQAFFTAEEYHQRYYEQNPQRPYCSLVIQPKLEKLTQQFAHLLK